MSLFWQPEHLKLHPRVPRESHFEPGRKWKIGLASIGATATVETAPWTTPLSVPPSLSRVPQNPHSPGGMMQRRSQTRQRLLPSLSFS